MWLANLSDGETVAEREMDWDDLPIKEITCLHLVNGSSSAFMRAREGYQFFQYKKRAQLWNVTGGKITGVTKTPVFWQRIGAVINEHGDCMYIQTDVKGTFDTRFDNVLDMKLNLSALRIQLPPEVILAKEQQEMTDHGSNDNQT